MRKERIYVQINQGKLPKEIKCIEPDGGMFVWCTDTSGKINIACHILAMRKALAF